MANPPLPATAVDRRAAPVGGTALHGNIEAIGIHDLLRIAVTKGSTGRLLVFNDQTDAELYYEEGHLVSVTSSHARGRDQLYVVLSMVEGEFEFARGLQIDVSEHDLELHDAMLHAIKEHYQQRVRIKQEASDKASQVPRMSGVHRVAPTPTVSVTPEGATAVTSGPPLAPPRREEAPLLETPTVPRPSDALSLPKMSVTHPEATEPSKLVAGEIGRGSVDFTGRLGDKVGTMTSQESALAALVFKQSQLIANILGMRGLERFEILGTNASTLLCRNAKDKLLVSHTSADADVDAIWRLLDP